MNPSHLRVLGEERVTAEGYASLRVHLGRRDEALEQKEEKAVYSQRRSKHIFRLLDLPSEIDLDGVKATVREGLLDPALGKFISESEEFVGVHVFQDRESSTSTLGRDRV